MCRFRTESVGALNKIDGGWSKQIKFHVERDEYYSQIGIQVWQPATLGADVSQSQHTQCSVDSFHQPYLNPTANLRIVQEEIRLAMVVLQDKSAKGRRIPLLSNGAPTMHPSDDN
eukprot:TRINITY_DN300_c0_g1_i6.p1 TRINITY_DN300_c0_g1~~TRINITY_DN300_c0_g1_i6.p1  ORF type:complete len:115 (+),score=0.29 TRINITY_DN300_c0_g1_i6:199-543(+)